MEEEKTKKIKRTYFYHNDNAGNLMRRAREKRGLRESCPLLEVSGEWNEP